MTPRQLFGIYAEVMDELRRRKIVRSANNPVSDYAETLTSRTLGLELSGASNKGFDARDRNGIRYQIKARRLDGRSSRQLGVIRNLRNRPFDVCIAILFDRRFEPAEVYRIPIGEIRKYGKFSKHQNGWILQVRPPLTTDKRVRDMTSRFAKT
jgi:hypothetical protein